MSRRSSLRMVVIGRSGQVASALRHRSGEALDVVAVGRPECDLTQVSDLTEIFVAWRPDVIVNAAAYTAVDAAESDRGSAFAVNCHGASAAASAAERVGAPLIHLSTDYVFDGNSTRPYHEDDETNPINVYGLSKLAGEEAVEAATSNYVILRTSWVYAGDGHNFLRTMLRLARERDEIRIVSDQHGAPTAATDLAASIEAVARNLVGSNDASLRGLFHLTNSGTTTWAGFAGEIFSLSASAGGPCARVIPIATADYPTAARRPLRSELDNSKIMQRHGIYMSDWPEALQAVMEKLPENLKK